MRDVVLTAFILGSLPFILKRPQLGVAMYIWISVMNPHRLTWSFAYDLNFAAIVAAATLLATPFSKDLKWPELNGLSAALFLFVAWTGVTTIFALYPDESYLRWTTLMKTQLMVFLIPMLFHKREDIRLLIWVLVVSLGFYGTKGGIWTLLTGGSARVYGPLDSLIGDNTSIGLGILMVIPLMHYLQVTTTYRSVRWMLIGMMLFSGVAVLGTYSRGALLAAIAIAAFLWWKGRHKIPILLVLAVAAPIALSVMPEKWYERMDTIVNYHEEGSANMRLNSWGTMLNLAKARPLVGGGFEVAHKEVYDRYSPDASFPPQVAHSIYFQALGEHGFVGFALYLWLLAALWHKAGTIIRRAKRQDELAWAHEFSRMLQVTLIGFAVGGAFLSLVNLDVPYYIAGIMLATFALFKRELESSNPPAEAGKLTASNPPFADIRSAGTYRS
jgi:probable O-glycosylation ligase (exosortase A-associated)